MGVACVQRTEYCTVGAGGGWGGLRRWGRDRREDGDKDRRALVEAQRHGTTAA